MIKKTITCACLASLALISGCSQRSEAIQNIVSEYLRSKDVNRFAKSDLKPQFTYLEVHSNTNQALMVLGYTTQTQEHEPPVLTWYSGDYELFRTQGGRLLDVTGVKPSQQNTQLQWQLDKENPPVAIGRTFDQPEAELFAYSESLQARLVPSTEIELRTPLQLRLAGFDEALNWFIEPRGGDFNHLPASLYAFNKNNQPVYGSQCLTANHCYEWLYRNNENK